MSKCPNFLIGGTAAGGTSFLSAILTQNEKIYLPREMRPEPHFFYKTWEYEKGIDYYLSRWFDVVPDSAVAVGERSSSYLYGGQAVALRILANFPNMKFIFTLRNPIERTWANYRYTVLQGLESLSFEDALDAEPERVSKAEGIWAEIQPHDYTGRGYYATQLIQFRDYFDESSMLVIKSEQLSSDTNRHLAKVCQFLGLPAVSFRYTRPPDYTSMSVVDPRIQVELRDYFSERFDQIIEGLRTETPVDHLISDAQDTAMMARLMGNLVAQKSPMPVSIRPHLKKLFRQEIASLQAMLDIDFSDWT